MNSNIPSDAIVSLLLFLVGVPALVYQMVPEEIRGLVIPRGSFILKFASPLIVGVLAAAGSFIVGEWIHPDWKPTTWYITVGVLFLLCILTGVMIFLTISKERLIDNLWINLAKNYREGGEYPDDDLAKLELIGKESKAGEEREWSIKALDKLADRVLTSESYSGRQLEGLTHALDHILLESGKASTPDNYRSAISILQKIITRSYKSLNDNREFHDADLGHAWRYLRLWGQKSLNLPEQGITVECLNLLDIEDGEPNPALSEALREIGIAAAKHEGDQMQIALQAARKIQIILLEGDAQLHPEVMYDLIGLLAYIWLHGQSGEAWVRREFEIASDETLKWTQCAIEHHRRTGHFEIADKVKLTYDAWKHA